MRIGLNEHFTLKKLLRFVLPTVVTIIFTQIYSIVDGIFVTNFAGKNQFAAINLIMPLLIIMGSLGFMLGTGGSALVAKTLGEGDPERANGLFSMMVIVMAIVGVILSSVGEIFIVPVARLLGASGETLGYCVLYGRFMLATQTFFILQNIFQSFFVVAEKARLGLIVTAIAGVMNIVLDALFVAAAVGQAIATQASISGAEGGCQAECGSAAAMAAAALVYLEGGNPQQCADAAAFALMNLLGLVCDPVGGLVEVPCVYRNVGASGIAFTAADMVLSGIRCPIEPDEVILAMKEVGDALPTSLRETGEGGCAACESICKRLHHKE